MSWLIHLALGTARGRAEQAWHLAVLLAASTVVLVVVDRLVRRALPLATLLELTLLFPDRAPSRLGVARDASRKRPVEEQLTRVREAGADPAVAAREILALVAALRVHDRPTRGHAERVRMYTDLIADAMKVPERDRDLLRWAAILHDVGKLRVPTAVLNKPGKPTDDEWAVLRAHPAHGAEIASALLPWLGEWGRVIVEHHERYDGTGYPTGLAGRQISLGGRIVSVADAFDVMTAARAYRRPVSRAAACRELVKWSGTQFDPVVVRAMVGQSAPRVRRAQGLLAWLGDVPIVATSYVPVATVARVVGAGALATSAATGVAVPVATASPAHHDQGRATVAAAKHSTVVAPPGSDTRAGAALHQADVTRAVGNTGAPVAAEPDPATGAPVDSPAAAPEDGSSTAGSAGGSGSGSSGSDSSGSGSSGSGSSGSGGSDSGHGSGSSGSGSGSSGSSGGLSGTVQGVGDTVDGVTDVVDDTVGTVTGVVGGSTGQTVDDVVGTVTGTVDGVTGTVTGVLGGLLGGHGGHGRH